MKIEQAHSQERETANERSKGVVGGTEPRKHRDDKLTKREGSFVNKKRGRSDVEIDRRVFNGHTVVLLEDRSMMKLDGTSGQYIIAIESAPKDDKVPLVHKRYISDLMKKKGYANSYEGARAVFLNPERFRGIMGEHWIGYETRKSSEDERCKEVGVAQLPLFGL